MRLFFLVALLPLVVTGCVTAPAKQTVRNIDGTAESSKPRADSDGAGEGFAFAQARCASCHNVTGGQVSPNPIAPLFEAIANTRGRTYDTLKAWLRESHNYPEQMDFEIDAKQIENLTDYMLTLKSQDYRPPIQ